MKTPCSRREKGSKLNNIREQPRKGLAGSHRPTGFELGEQSRGSGSNRSHPQSSEPQKKAKLTSPVQGQFKHQFKNKARNKFSDNIAQWKNNYYYQAEIFFFFQTHLRKPDTFWEKYFLIWKHSFSFKKKHSKDVNKFYLMNFSCLCGALSILITPLLRYDI